jgi:hypothetical protein
MTIDLPKWLLSIRSVSRVILGLQTDSILTYTLSYMAHYGKNNLGLLPIVHVRYEMLAGTSVMTLH